MFNKSEIIKRAWTLSRTGNYADFGSALRQAWREAKRSAEKRSQGYVTVTELKSGDTIAVGGYGGYDDNNFTATITGIDTIVFNKGTVYEKSSPVINFVTKSGMEGSFCADYSEMIRRITKVAAEIAA